MLKRMVVAGLWRLSLGLDDMADRFFGMAIPEVSFLPTLMAVELEHRWFPRPVAPAPPTSPVVLGQTWWAEYPAWPQPDQAGLCGSPTVLLSAEGVIAVRCNRSPHSDDRHVHHDGGRLVVEWEDLPGGAVRFETRGVL